MISQDNPADCNSRGLSVTQLRDSNLWWNGPEWLSLSEKEWPFSKINQVDDDPIEIRSTYKAAHLNVNEIAHIDQILSRFSNFNQLRHCFAYVRRYTLNLFKSIKTANKQKIVVSAQPLNELIKHIHPPTVDELDKAENIIIRWIQSNEYATELNAIQTNQLISRSSKLFRLHPFLDSDKLMRVNGRLQNSFLSYDEQFPIIIPSKHRFAQLLIEFYHRQTLHGGPSVTINQIRQRFWVLHIRTFARHVIHKCVRCFRNKPVLSTQLMGSLPAARVNDTAHPFAATIVDYAGPYDIRASKGRGQKSYKGYVAVFVCMATKAVHLEAAGDLSTQTFLHALERFIARRGMSHDMFSDCGTNFVGASNELDSTQKDFEQRMSADVLPYLNSKGIRWHFSPPGAPHFNGLAEAAVKSMKFHLCRIIGEAKLTFEEFSTVLARIEAVLNSRPISPISNNPSDFTALTPGHFLTGRPLLARPQRPSNENPTMRHQFMDRIAQHFWERFRKKVLSAMQIRPKWNSEQPNINKNDLVVTKDDRFPVNHWPLGRVIDVHPGSDGLIRVATVKTQFSMLKRPIAKLTLVPINDSINNCRSKS